MRPDPNANSNFASPSGAALLFLGFLAASRFQAAPLAAFLFAAAVVMLAAWIWGRYALERIKVTMHGESQRVFPGGDAGLSFTVVNEKWLPLLWLTIGFPEAPLAPRMPEKERFRRLSGVRPWQARVFRQKLPTQERGVWYLNQLECFSGDGLGLAVSRKILRAEQGMLLVVYPKVHSVRTEELPMMSSELMRGGRGWQEDLTLMRNIRDYQPGDPVKRINWRVLAGQGKWQVNQYEEIRPQRMTMLLDLESFRWKEEAEGKTVPDADLRREQMEEMISLAASLILRFEEQRAVISLILPGTLLQPPAGEEGKRELLTALAGIRYDGGRAVLPFDEMELASGSFGQLYVFVRREVSPACRRWLDVFPEHRICLVVSGEDRTVQDGTAGAPAEEQHGVKLPWRTVDRRQLLG